MRWPRLSEKRRVTQTKQMITKRGGSARRTVSQEEEVKNKEPLCLIARNASRLQEAPVTDL